MECTGGDEALFREVVGLFFEDCPRLLGQIREAIASDDGPTLKRAAHTLKGTAGHFAAPGVVAAVTRLEEAGHARSCRGASADLDALVSALDLFFDDLGNFAPEIPPWRDGAALGVQEYQPCP